MTWTLLNLQFFMTQLLQDLWTSTLTGTSFEDLTTLVSQVWLQGTFYNLSPDEIVSLLSFSTSFYILINILPFQIQATTNSRPSTSRLDRPLPVFLAITALLAFAIGLTTVSPWDWSPILHLLVGNTYCALLQGCYFLRAA